MAAGLERRVHLEYLSLLRMEEVEMSFEYNATVTFRADLAPGTLVLRVKPDGGAFPYEAGQYTVLGLRKSAPRVPSALPDPPALQSRPDDLPILRAYSITSNSRADELEFVVTLVTSGALSPRLFGLKERDRLFVEGRASGIFTLRTSSGNRDLLLVATGSALAPYLSMIRSEHPQAPKQNKVVVHAAAVSADLVFRSQLEDLARASSHLTYLPILSGEPGRDPGWTARRGTVEDFVRSGDLEDALGMPITPERFDVYLAGSPEMIDAVTAALVEKRFLAGDPRDPATDIHVERYW
jgi:ferredoxin/flavodoxin---NADP+ reductase